MQKSASSRVGTQTFAQGFLTRPRCRWCHAEWILKKLVRKRLAAQGDAGNGALQLLPPLPLHLPKLPKILPIFTFQVLQVTTGIKYKPKIFELFIL